MPIRVPTIHEAGTAIVATAAVAGALTYFGVGMTVPWARAEDFAMLEQSVDKMLKQQDNQGRALLILQRDYYQKELDEAEKELRKDPNNALARKQKDNAEKWIRYIDAQLDKPPG
jgi:thioredoxin-like negative regulator of GroEL